MTINPTNQFLVNGNDDSSKPKEDKPMTTLQDDDLFLVNRNEKSYTIKFSELKEDLGGIGEPDDEIDPKPGEETVTPPYKGGTGTEDDPYIITPTTCFLSGEVYSEQRITFFNQDPGKSVYFEEISGDTKNGTRFRQPIGTINDEGKYSFRLRFQDVPQTLDPAELYTGLIRCGEVHWSWQVNVIEKGIKKPSILKIKGTDGKFWDAPTSPLFNTIDGPVAALDPGKYSVSSGQSSAALKATGGSGSGLEAKFITDDSAEIIYIEIVNGGEDYGYGDKVTFDLSSIGGSSTQEMTAYVNPATGPSAVFQITAFDEINAGGFKEMQWQFCTEPSFEEDVKSTTVVSTETTVGVPTGIDPCTEYYARFRYVGNDTVDGENIVSAYCDPARSATTSVIRLRYIMKNYNVIANDAKPSDKDTQYLSCDSGELLLSPVGGTAVVLIPWNTYGGALGGTTSGGAHPGAKGEGTQGIVYLQVRNEIQVKVTEVNPDGGVIGGTLLNRAVGINDYYKNQAPNSLGPYGGNAAPMLGGSGSGCKIDFFQRESDGTTQLYAVEAPGSGYKVDDVITFTPPYGDGAESEGKGIIPRAFGEGSIGGGPTSLTLDSTWDVLVHGLGGAGGQGGTKSNENWRGPAGKSGGWFGAGRDGGPGKGYDAAMRGIGGPLAVNGLYAKIGQSQSGDVCGGGGGAGFDAGTAGKNSNASETNSSGGGGGGASYLNTELVPNLIVNTSDYSGIGIQLYVNRNLVGDADKDGPNASAVAHRIL